jgi:hypothetical protein
MKLIIAGGRGFNNYDMLTTAVNNLIDRHPDIDIIVSGTARGADELGERYAKDNSVTVERYPAQWDKYGKSAGYRRNEQMAELADACICFWDGVSKGTEHMINLSRKHNLITVVVRY